MTNRKKQKAQIAKIERHRLNKVKMQMCREGNIELDLLKALKDLNEQNAEIEKEAQEEERKRIESILEFEKQMERESREPIDYKRSIYGSFRKPSQDKAFKITFKDHPEYSCIAFAPTHPKACAKGAKTIRELYFPTFTSTDCPVQLRETKAHRCQELDEFATEGKVPIPSLLKAGFEFTCSSCGKVHFNYQDYATRKCFIVEGEGDIVPYAKGMIFCYSCYHKYFS